jgi:aryl-alcohol dehydrogenase-like predicted oxidoreductase
LDVYYLHNPYEAQGPYNTDPEFFDRLSNAFEFLEKAVQDGKIRDYGMATYSCFRVKPSEQKLYLSLQKVHRLAEKVGGTKHHFRFVQTPINVMMPEAFCEPWQQFEDKDGVERQKMLV